MAKAFGWIACCAFGVIIGSAIIYAASETADDVADYREDH
jgi:tryptophan synthase alpha subunit